MDQQSGYNPRTKTKLMCILTKSLRAKVLLNMTEVFNEHANKVVGSTNANKCLHLPNNLSTAHRMS